MPGVLMSTRKKEMPACLSAAPSVLAIRIPQSAAAATGAPHLLAVHDVAVAVEHGTRREAAEIASRPGLAEQLAPDLVGGERRPQVPGLLFGRAEPHDRPARQDEADHVQERRHAGTCTLLEPHALVLEG